jgi:hypothetical protein
LKAFIQKPEQDVMGSLSGFDRLVFRGILRRLFYPQGMDYCLAFWGVLLKQHERNFFVKKPETQIQ